MNGVRVARRSAYLALALVALFLPSPFTNVNATGFEPQVRPGVGIRVGAPSFDGEFCTGNFLFQGDNGKTYFGTAGHCVSPGQSVWIEGVQIGSVRYSILGDGDDFALIELEPDLQMAVVPSMCYWGGPISMGVPSENISYFPRWRNLSENLPEVLYFGEGGMNEPQWRARRGNLDEWGENRFLFLGSGGAGDSGAPVLLETGATIGLMTTGIGTGIPASPGAFAGPSLADQVDLAEQALGVSLSILTAPLRDPPGLDGYCAHGTVAVPRPLPP